MPFGAPASLLAAPRGCFPDGNARLRLRSRRQESTEPLVRSLVQAFTLRCPGLPADLREASPPALRGQPRVQRFWFAFTVPLWGGGTGPGRSGSSCRSSGTTLVSHGGALVGFSGGLGAYSGSLFASSARILSAQTAAHLVNEQIQPAKCKKCRRLHACSSPGLRIGNNDQGQCRYERAGCPFRSVGEPKVPGCCA